MNKNVNAVASSKKLKIGF